MFGGASKEKKWKQEHKQHISNYNSKYYSSNKNEILTKRKIKRITNKSSKNTFLGF